MRRSENPSRDVTGWGGLYWLDDPLTEDQTSENSTSAFMSIFLSHDFLVCQFEDQGIW